eukprot:1082268-Amphidinium_carterae.1
MDHHSFQKSTMSFFGQLRFESPLEIFQVLCLNISARENIAPYNFGLHMIASVLAQNYLAQNYTAMLGKRVRSLPPGPTVSDGKRLRLNLQDLAATGQVSIPRIANILNDAFAAGVRECYSPACQRGCTKPEILFNEFLKDSAWPRLVTFPIPLLNRGGDQVPGKLCFTLPHEVLAALVAASSLSAVEEIGGLDDTTLQHCMAVSSELGHPLSFWQDGVPFNWDLSESLEVYSWSLPSQTCQGLCGNSRELSCMFKNQSSSTHIQVKELRCKLRAPSVNDKKASDSDWAGCAVTRHSTTGVILLIHGCSIIHYSRTQSTIAQASAVAEVYAHTSAPNELIHVQLVVIELGLATSPSKVNLHAHTDSANGKAMTQKLGISKKSKHIQLKYLHLQELVEQGVITRHKVNSLLNPSDKITKFMPQATLTKHFNKAGIHEGTPR